MNSKQENRFSMFLTVRDFLRAQQTTTDTLPGFVILQTDFQKVIADIQKHRNVQEGNKSGVTETKKQLRDQLFGIALELRHKLVAFAIISNNLVLQKEVEYSEIELRRPSDNVLCDRTKLLLYHGEIHQTAAAAYGVTIALLLALKTAIASFEAAIPQPRITLNERKAATENIELSFLNASQVLEKLDALVHITGGTHNEFLKGYTRARRIVNLGAGRKLALKGQATDASGNPISNVKFEILTEGAETQRKAGGSSIDRPLIIKRTTDKGNFKVQHLAGGSYKALVKKTGFMDQLVNFHLVSGETANLQVVLEAQD